MKINNFFSVLSKIKNLLRNAEFSAIFYSYKSYENL